MYKVGGYVVTFEEVREWAKRSEQELWLDFEEWVDHRLEELGMEEDFWAIGTAWPRPLNEVGTLIVILARLGRHDPKATLAYCTRFRELEDDLKLKKQLEEQGLKPIWRTIPDPYMLGY